jgi:peptidoglycan/xylan/chitin deacetylase (PgdA/CDA1 family)
VKCALAHGLYAVGLLQLWQHVVLRRKAVILMYHRVLTPDEMRESGSHPAMIVESQTFADQMAVVKRRFKVLSVEEFMAKMERKLPFENSSCLITFDDGWRDNFTNALPILRRYELPAVVFLPVNFIGEQRLFWQESLVHSLGCAVATVRKDPARKAQFTRMLEPVGLAKVLDISDDDPRSQVIEAISRNRTGWTPSSIETTLVQLRNELGLGNGDVAGTDSFLDWAQIAEMTRQGVTFGGHGAEHQLLSEMPIDKAREDIQRSKEFIDRRCKAPVSTFSYPRGYRTPQVVELVKAAGFQLAFIANGGRVSSADDPFTLRRINIYQDATASTPMFMARIVGLF